MSEYVIKFHFAFPDGTKEICICHMNMVIVGCALRTCFSEKKIALSLLRIQLPEIVAFIWSAYFNCQ